uniref:Immunoglobulin domain-containing protein n=1 Tax=Naja naja TaxID=35670 RepID=A0A8C7DXC0_NAJNA
MTITKTSTERNGVSQKQGIWGARISLHCSFGSLASWYKETEQDNHQEIMNSSRIHVTRNTSVVKMQINKLQHTDNGIYYCKSQDLSKPSCGTELKVMGIRTFEQVQSHHNMKDAIILIQTILLVLFVSLPVFLTQGKGDRKDASGEEHTYEGLTVELVDTYEDIGVYQDRPEKWDLAEHPCEE